MTLNFQEILSDNHFGAVLQPGAVIPHSRRVSKRTDQNRANVVVILAEDEFLVRMMAVDVLTAAGFKVHEVGHADEALALLKSDADNIHVLFTDIHMPGSMSGLELAHHVRLHWPWIGLLIASARVRPETSELPDGSRFLPKPYEPDHVVTHIQELTTLR